MDLYPVWMDYDVQFAYDNAGGGSGTSEGSDFYFSEYNKIKRRFDELMKKCKKEINVQLVGINEKNKKLKIEASIDET